MLGSEYCNVFRINRHIREHVNGAFCIFMQALMKAKNYSDFDTHKAAHVAFVDKVKGLSVPISADVVAYAKDW
jgi:hemerythrin